MPPPSSRAQMAPSRRANGPLTAAVQRRACARLGASLRARLRRAGSLSSVRRPLVVGALAAALALGAVAAVAVYERWTGHDVRGSPTVEFVTTDVPPQAPAPARRQLLAAWPTYGFDARRLRSAPGIQLRPPFRRVWTFHGR